MDAINSAKTKQYRYLALIGYLSLISWVLMWQVFISPHPHINPYTAAIAWCIPLLFPLRGILSGKAYTHAWANFVLMLYFLHSLTILYVDQGERWLAAIELLITSATFVASVLYARNKGRELGLKLPKLSEIEKQEKAKYSKQK
ncbi:DUF2069 domain-containing protein [Vibrio sp. SCSIO 43137]|uniref:DUF2069 domain-containing protein n=1 Tax=Vibrio sp. SCSIO 43137 TaxID=3021011 RepID=UPI002307497A|nr:DUF2069 domain-containing protein [Vibrio sp. SCSIO 43137]WCE30446.1 DUF2069 domain-containing protein [Vibrio sp. SCSIO 43137]